MPLSQNARQWLIKNIYTLHGHNLRFSLKSNNLERVHKGGKSQG
ncbi:hypothetical protein [Mastigocoleus sp. MO_188.B34]|nr:hypothetical protein [Mastigocoleus sp. MO_188.B34]MDJ0695963.1 hypothetical protein [Mastigocoleus sp. MO_188.B34]